MTARRPLRQLFNLATAMALSLMLCAAGANPALAGAWPFASGEIPTLAPMLEQAKPAVVNIATRGRVRVRVSPLFDDPFFRRFFDLPQFQRERATQSLGSGVIVDADAGLVITNHHVIENAEQIRVTLSDGRELDAELVGSDPASDVAVIRIPAAELAAIPWADSDALRVGDFVVAIGNPFGLGQTVTSGIISALQRSGLGIEDYEDFIQTDASINPGNSGGALVDLRGQLAGINTAIVGPSGGNVGIGFAIPANMARGLMEQLVEFGEVRRGRLGLAAQDLDAELAAAFGLQRSHGAVVVAVEPGSAAAAAGLRIGDVITAVDGRPIRRQADMRNVLGLLRVGQRVDIEVLRDGGQRTLSAQIAPRRDVELRGEQLSPRLAGALLREEVQKNQYQEVEYLRFAAVAPGSPAWAAGLREGDIIRSLNRARIADLEDLRRVVERAAGGRLLFNLQRGRQALFALVE